MNDKDMIALFEAREEKAIQECQKAYGNYCHSIIIKNRVAEMRPDFLL